MFRPMDDPMADKDLDYVALQHRYPGKFVARRINDVLISADSYEELDKVGEAMGIDWETVTIEYIEPPDRVVAY